ncbi:MAG: hypothetical protein DRP42_02640 [Tenericutes bacterium]|nr:MAG: hypothetical protein DRP42_02640 [Mycoplasmatota bacterium]
MAKKFLSDIELDAGLVDVNGNTGTSGQILSSTGSSVSWVNQEDIEVEKTSKVVLTVKNVSGGTLSKGAVVHAAPTANPPSGNVIEVLAAENDVTASMPAIAILNEQLADDAEGEAVMFGRVSGIDTSSFSTGDELFVSDIAGTFTSTKPTGTKLIQKIAVVIKVHASNGTIEVFGAGRTNDVPTPLYVDHANQRLGIGTTSPQDKLHVVGSVRGDFKIEGGYASGTTDVAKLTFGYTPRGGDTNNKNIAFISAYNTATDSTSGGYLSIGTRATNGSLSEHMRIDSSGNVSMASGNSVGKFAVLSSGVHPSYDFYNNGTTYLNGFVTIDHNLDITSSGVIRMAGTEVISATRAINATSGNFAGDVSVEDNLYLTDAGTVRAKIQLNSSDRDNLDIKAVSLGSLMRFYTVDTLALTLDDSQNATFAGDVTVTGNLSITGDIDSYNVNNLDVVDKLITVGKGQTEANSNGSGILVDGSNASLLWDESNNTWDFNKSLDIVGNLNASGNATFAGNVNSSTISIDDYVNHNGDADTYFGFPTANEFKLVAGGSNIIAADANSAYLYYQGSTKLQTTSTGVTVTGGGIFSGNVGIGTTNPSSANGFDAKLQLESANPMLVYKETDQSTKWEVGAWGGNYVVYNGTNERMRITSSGNVAIYETLQFFDDSSTPSASAFIHRPSSNTLALGTNSTERMRIDSSGNVELNGSAGPLFSVKSTATGTPTAFVYASTNGADFGSLTNHPTRFYVNNSEKMRIDSSGNVGIGTSPSSDLHINNSTTSPVLRLSYEPVGGYGGGGSIRFQGGASDYVYGDISWYNGSNRDAHFNYTAASRAMHFKVNERNIATNGYFKFYNGSTEVAEINANGVYGNIFYDQGNTSYYVNPGYSGNSFNALGYAHIRGGITTDGNARSYTWRALDNTSNSSNLYYRIARITSNQSSRFLIELAGRSTSYGDGALPAMGYIVGQLNNDNNYDIVYYNHSTSSSEVVTEIGQVDINTVSTDIYVKVGQFAEITATGHISDGSITPYGGDSASVSAPTGYSQVSELTVWNSGNDGSGSGLDADTLDGQHASDFASSSHNHDGDYVELTGDTMSGPLVIDEASTTDKWLFRVDNNGSNFSGFWSASQDIQLYLRDDAGNVRIQLRPDARSLFYDGLEATNLYDSDNTSYYVNPGDTSNLQELEILRNSSNYTVNLNDAHDRAGLMVKSSTAFDSKLAFSSGASSRQYIQALNNAHTTGRDIVLNPYGGNVGIGITAPVSKLHVYNNDGQTSTAAGITVEQDGGGDAIVQYLLTGIKRWTTGIDNSDGDKFKISQNTDLSTDNVMTLDTSGNVGIGTTSPTSLLHVLGSPVATSGALITARNNDATSSNTTFGGIMFNSSPGTDYSIGKSNVNSATTLSFRNANTGASYMDINSSGNVGIGTASPTRIFHSKGGSGVSTIGKFEGGTANAYIQICSTGQSDNDSGYIGYDSSRVMTLWTANTERMRIDSSGRVGIGTISPGAKLQINNAATVGSTSSHLSGLNPILYLDAGNAAGRSIVIKNHSTGNDTVAGALRFAVSPDGANFSHASIEAKQDGNGAVDTLEFRTSSSNTQGTTNNLAMIIEGGDVGIGTTSPGQKLHVNGNVAADIYYDRNNTGYFFNGDASKDNVDLTSGGNFAINVLGTISGGHRKHNNLETPEMQWSIGGSTDLNWKKLVDVVLGDANYSGWGAEIEITNFSGNFGSATYNGGELFKGALSIYHWGGSGYTPEVPYSNIPYEMRSHVRWYKIQESGQNRYQLQVKSPGNYQQLYIKVKPGIGNQVADLISYANDTNGATSGGTAYTSSQSADFNHEFAGGIWTNSSRNIGWKTIYGSPYLSTYYGSIITSSSVYIGGSTGNGQDLFCDDLRSNKVFDRAATAYYFEGGNTGDSIRVAGDVVAYYSSDKRLKDNIKPIENALDKVNAISGVTFEWNEKSHKTTGRKDVGVVAQEVEEVFPEIVETRTNGFKAVDYQKLTAVLIESVKELTAKVEALESKQCNCK